MFIRKPLVLITLFAFLAGATFAESQQLHRIAIVPLTLEQGFPLKIALTEKVRSKINEPVHGKILEPVYAFDREVIPAGTEVLGKVTALRPVGKWKRVTSMLGGDFTPLHDAEITFETLVLQDGKQISLQASAVSRGNLLVRFKNGKTRTYTNGTQQPPKELIHTMLWSLSPYHPQFVPNGATYKATLEEPLEFGNIVVGSNVLNAIGSQPDPGSVMYARLLTPLDSKT